MRKNGSGIKMKALFAMAFALGGILMAFAVPAGGASPQNTKEMKLYFTDTVQEFSGWAPDMAPLSNSFALTKSTPADSADKSVAFPTATIAGPVGGTIFFTKINEEMKVSSDINIRFWVSCDAVSVSPGGNAILIDVPDLSIYISKNGQDLNDALTATYQSDDLHVLTPGAMVEVNHSIPINTKFAAGDEIGVKVIYYGLNVKEMATVKFVLGSTAHPSSLTVPVNVPKIASSIALTADMSEKYVKPGEAVAFTIAAKNNGAENASFNFTANCTSANWTCTLTPEKADVAAGASQNVTLVVSCPASAIKGDKASVKVMAGDSAIELTVTASEITSGGAVVNSVDENKTPGFEFAILAVAIVAAVFLMRRK